MKLVRISAGLALLLAASPPGAAAPRKDENYDPNREVCKSVPVVGSRLKRVRECHSAQQWEEMKYMERQGLMRKQFNGNAGCPEAIGCYLQPGAKDSPN